MVWGPRRHARLASLLIIVPVARRERGAGRPVRSREHDARPRGAGAARLARPRRPPEGAAHCERGAAIAVAQPR